MKKISSDKLDKIIKLAKDCTSQEWLLDAHGNVVTFSEDGKSLEKIAEVDFLENAEYIAATHPQFILQIIERLQILENHFPKCEHWWNPNRKHYQSWCIQDEDDWIELDEDGLCSDCGGMVVMVSCPEEDALMPVTRKEICQHWQHPEDYDRVYYSYCQLLGYTVPEGGEPDDYCGHCGGKIEIIDCPTGE